MPPRMTPAQAQAKIRQAQQQLRRAQQQQRQALNKLQQAARKYDMDVKRAVDKHNADVRGVVDQHNREARAHNQRVRSDRARLRRELNRLQNTQGSRYLTYRDSVTTLGRSWERVEAAAPTVPWLGADMLDLAERETANSAAALSELLDPSDDPAVAHRLADTEIDDELAELDEDLDRRWRGALFALSPANPDAARHFCTSSREILTTILETWAPDDEVEAVFPDEPRTEHGTITRRTRIRYCLHRRGRDLDELADFVADDIANVTSLFRVFNDGTHGHAGRFTITQLAALKRRVEDAILFLHRTLRAT